MRIRRIIVHIISIIFASVLLAAGINDPKRFSHDWLQFNYDPQHSGFNSNESMLGQENVSNLRLIFRAKLPSVADGTPVFLSNVETKAGRKDLLFVTTKEGHIVALEAETGSQVWAHQNPAGNCKINRESEPCYTTSSPAIDPDRQYVYSYGLDGKVHKYRVGDGTEVTSGGWPQVTTLKPFDEKGSSALSVATAKSGKSYLYVSHSGYIGDRGDYQGHITTIELANGKQQVFNANCSNQAAHFEERPKQPDCTGLRSAIWARPGVVYDPYTDRIYAATGNGPFEPRKHNWGDTVFSINPDGTGKAGDPLDTYTPRDYRKLELLDADLGSTAPALLTAPSGSATTHIAVQGGKDKKLRLLNLRDLSGKGKIGQTGGEIEAIDVPQGGMVLTTPAVWSDPADKSTLVFVTNKEGVSALKLIPGSDKSPHLTLEWKSSKGGTSPVIANGVLYYAGQKEIRALELKTGRELWHSNEIGGIHWESPIIVNGTLYITDESASLLAFSIKK